MIDEKILFAPGHTACAGCGQSLAARLVIDASGKNTIVGNNTGCLEVFSTGYPYSSWRVPFIHSLFENTGAVMSGVEAALRHLGAKEGINLIAQAGDGGFGDIGLQAFSGLWERGQDILTICYDNEAYMNTGIQRSGLTPIGSRTTTTPVGPNAAAGNVRSSFSFKKNLVDIALAHRCVYVATASVHVPLDLQRRVKEAHKMKGPKFLHILCPCPLGWQSDVSLTAEIGRLAVETGIWPLVEYKNGELVNVKKFKELKPVEEYLKLQRRYNHLFQGEAGAQALEAWRAVVQENVKRFGLLEPTAQA
jgi:pyruvate ferredoxin oxidoreductase beta subunit